MANDDAIARACAGMAERSELMDKAVDAQDIMLMADIFLQEQAAHLMTLAELSDDPEEKVTLLETGLHFSSILSRYFQLQ